MSSPASDADRRIGPYRLLHLLGEGGAARTWAATDPRDGAPLAVKELQLLKTAHPKQIELFERECAILRDLEHAQIPTFIQTIVERHAETLSLYLVQERIVGRSLQQLLDLGVTFAAPDVVAVMRSALLPLSYLHQRTPPLYHRDIKPSNIIIRVDGTCVLIDFGAVREALADPRAGGSSVVGTFGYMAPEQFQARAWAATDLYALGATAIHLLTGIEPGRFEIRRLKPDFHDALDTDPHLAAILDLLLEPNVEDRYATTEALVRALDRWESKHGDGRTDDERLRAVVERGMNAIEAGAEPVDRGPGSAVDALDRSTLAAGGDPLATSVAVGGRDTLPLDAPRVEAALATAASDDSTDAASTPTTADAEVKDGATASGEAEASASTADEHAASTTPASAETGAAGDGTATATDADADADPTGDTADTTSATPAESPPAASAPASAKPDDPRYAALPPRRNVERVPVERDPLGVASLVTPGELGANVAGLYFMVSGVVLLAWAVFGGLEYNARVWMALGAGLATLGLVQAVWPRRPVGRSRPDLRRSGSTAPVRITRIRRRTSPVGATEWVVDYEYEASDGLHYANAFRVPSAKTARRVADDPDQIVVRYAAADPSWSILVVRP